MKKVNVIGAYLLALLTAALLTAGAFMLGRCTAGMMTDPPQTHSDTVIRRDTVSVPDPQPHLVTQEVIRYKYVPVTVDAVPDTVVRHDTIIRVEDGVAVIPISLKTYTDSSTYKAVVSGYDPRLESIEVYQEQMIITNTVTAEPRWTFGLQGGVYMTPKGLQPGLGFGAAYTIPVKIKKKHKSKGNK